MTTTLGHALLGLLAQQPATGYELARRLRRPVGYFWAARHSQIYPELARLEAAGQVRHSVVEGAGPRATKRYRVTATGRREVRTWLLATTADVEDREILLRVYLLSALDPDDAARVMGAIRTHHEQTLAHYQDQRSGPGPARGEWDAETTSRLTLEWGITFEENRIRWCDEVLEVIARAQSALPA